jgi:hypothetical protein
MKSNDRKEPGFLEFMPVKLSTCCSISCLFKLCADAAGYHTPDPGGIFIICYHIGDSILTGSNYL